jgi:tRNA nucleotidyltransferase (CCA-adding enzyme)
MRRLLSRLGQQAIRDLIRLRRADALATGTADPQALEASLAETEALLERLLAQEGRFTLADLEVDGNDLIALGIPRGRQIGGVLRRLFDAVLEGNCQNERASLMEYVQKITTETESR